MKFFSKKNHPPNFIRTGVLQFAPAFFAFIIFFCGPIAPPVFAAEFLPSYDLTYTVASTGITTTEQVVRLKNNQDHLYATEYSLIIGSTKLDAISARDDFGLIQPLIDVKDNVTTIGLVFDHKVVGKDQTRTMTVTYNTPDFATVKGKVLEVGFPLLSQDAEIDDYSVTLKIPKSFGDAQLINPPPRFTQEQGNYRVISFTKSDLLGKTSITATFGTEQVLDFELRYTLDNPTKTRGRTEIALPADTNFQRLLYTSIDPKPQQITIDPDGNWLAQYLLEPQSTMKIIAKGKAKLLLKPLAAEAKDLTEQEIKDFTKADQYWPVSDPSIQKLAAELKDPQGVYTYLVQHFKYNYNRLKLNTERLGALEALANPDQAICMEFTDAFVTLVRAQGIPAREHNGYGYAQNDKLRPLSLEQDVLHAWPAYWDKTTKQWIQVDPTWGNTTGGLDFFNHFDLDHVTFVVHGLESSYPITAGSYKTENTEGKDVQIAFSTEFEPVETIAFEFSSFPSGFMGLPTNGRLYVTNTGTAALYNLPVTLSLTKNQQTEWNLTQPIKVLPPFAQETIPVVYHTSWQQEGGAYLLKAEALNQTAQTEFSLKRPISPTFLTWIGGGIVGGGLWFLGFFKARKIVFKPRRGEITQPRATPQGLDPISQSPEGAQ